MMNFLSVMSVLILVTHDIKIEGIVTHTKKGIVLLIPRLKNSLLDKISFLSISFITIMLFYGLRLLYLSLTDLTEQPMYLCSYHPPVCPLNIPQAKL